MSADVDECFDVLMRNFISVGVKRLSDTSVRVVQLCFEDVFTP